MSLVYSFTVDDGIKDGTFIEVSDTVKQFIKFRTVIGDNLYNKISTKNNDNKSHIICIIKDMAQMFCYAVKLQKNSSENILNFFCNLNFNLIGKPEKICAFINISRNEEPILTFFLPEDR